jgi:hypothetical protein
VGLEVAHDHLLVGNDLAVGGNQHGNRLVTGRCFELGALTGCNGHLVDDVRQAELGQALPYSV